MVGAPVRKPETPVVTYVREGSKEKRKERKGEKKAHLDPRVMLISQTRNGLRRRAVGVSPCFGNAESDMCDACGTDLEAFTEEFALGVDATAVFPARRLTDAGRDRLRAVAS
jgi:hypothetical protein